MWEADKVTQKTIAVNADKGGSTSTEWWGALSFYMTVYKPNCKANTTTK